MKHLGHAILLLIWYYTCGFKCHNKIGYLNIWYVSFEQKKLLNFAKIKLKICALNYAEFYPTNTNSRDLNIHPGLFYTVLKSCYQERALSRYWNLLTTI